MRKWMAAVAVVVMMGLALVATSGTAAASDDTNVSGTGWLTATGSGAASVTGSGFVKVRGGGVLKITDMAGDAVVKINGNGVSVNRGEVTVYAGFTGEVSVAGTSFEVELASRGVHLDAIGNGTVKLAGTGTYRYNGTNGVWAIPATIITISR